MTSTRAMRLAIGIYLAILFSFMQVLSMIHHAVRIRLGDTQEGWSITFAVSMFVTPAIVAAFLMWAIEPEKENQNQQ